MAGLATSLVLLLVGPSIPALARQPHPDPLVEQKLQWFQDQKLGLLMHWGPYCQWGVVESWSICPEDEDWTKRRGPYADDYFAYVDAYERLQTTFDPVKFDPDAWALAARAAGMRYVVFTTKHHDGFCMFDTHQTDYKITAASCPFSRDPRADVTHAIFTAFRAQGLGIGAYFSKPDWHSPDYWWPYFPPFDRNVNYDIPEYPARWEAFKAFTYAQVEELMTGYGTVDILWLDGGWVQPMTATSPRWGKSPCDQDIDMPRIATMARGHQPGLIIVDRAVDGPYQDYRTPEQEVPDTPPDAVWETCMTMGTSWSYVSDDTYKPAAQLVHLLVEIVARGGNLLLNIGPGPGGELPPVSLDRLAELGAWLDVNGPAIYATRAIAPYQDGDVCYTRSADGTLNVIVLLSGDEAPGTEVVVPSFAPRTGGEVTLLGGHAPLIWQPRGEGCVITIPADIRRHPPCGYAWTLRFQPR